MDVRLNEKIRRLAALQRLHSVSERSTMAMSAINNSTDAIVVTPWLYEVDETRNWHIAVGSVSMALSLLVIFKVWLDSWRSAKSHSKTKSRIYFFNRLHPAEVFPLAFASVGFFSELIFVIVQSTALNRIWVSSCVNTAQVVFPAIFALPYIHLIFGAETTFRALAKPTFPKRGKWTLPICSASFVILLILTFIPTAARPVAGECFGGLIWRPYKYAGVAVGIISVLILAFISTASIIYRQLRHNKEITMPERIAGSRLVYYLLASTIFQLFILPFFVQAVSETFDGSYAAARVAEFMLYAQLSFLALIFLILRANATLFAIKPKDSAWQNKRRFRLWGPSELEIITISAPFELVNDNTQSKTESKEYRRGGPRKSSKEAVSTAPQGMSAEFVFPASSTTENAQWPLPAATPPFLQESPAVPPSNPQSSTPPASGHKKKPSYSLFPTDNEPTLPATVYRSASSSSSSKRTNSDQPSVERKPSTKTSPTVAIPASVEIVRSDSLSKTKPTLTQVNAKVVNVSDFFVPLGPPPTPLKPPAKQAPSRRRSSADSCSATVQIGIRLSAAPAALALKGSALYSPVRSPLSPGHQRSYSDPARPTLSEMPLDSPRHRGGSPEETAEHLDSGFSWFDIGGDSDAPQSKMEEWRRELIPKPLRRVRTMGGVVKLKPIIAPPPPPLAVEILRPQRLHSPPKTRYKDNSNWI